MKKLWIILSGVSLLLACGGTSERKVLLDEQEYLTLGDSIVTQVQTVLLTNVTGAIGKDGVTGAVSYCSKAASALTDSMGNKFDAEIRRLSDRNRNAKNGLNAPEELHAWQQMEQIMADQQVTKKHFITQSDGHITYYKAIPIGMAACLQCHGEKGTDITSETWALLHENYPEDKAYGYLLGQLRGMWQIQLSGYNSN